MYSVNTLIMHWVTDSPLLVKSGDYDTAMRDIEKLCNREKKGRIGLDLFKLNAS